MVTKQKTWNQTKENLVKIYSIFQCMTKPFQTKSS